MAKNVLERPGKIRDLSIDNMKAVCICLMVYAHTLPFCRDFLHIIVIPVFLMISGYCWHAKICSWGDFGRFFLKRLRALYVPFVLYNGTYALLGGLFLKLGFYTNDPALFEIARDWPIPQSLYGPEGFGGVLLVSSFYRYELSAAIISEVPVYLFSCTCAWVMMKSFSQGLTRIPQLTDRLSWIGRHTIPVMCLHVLCFKFCALPYMKLHALPKVYLAAWHTILDTSQLWKLLFALVGVGGSLGIAWLWYRMYAAIRPDRRS